MPLGVGLAYADRRIRKFSMTFWAPVGRLAWRREYMFPNPSAADRIGDEITRDGANCLLLRRGLFDGSPDKLIEAKSEIDQPVVRRGYS